MNNIDEYIKLPEGDTWNDKLIKSYDIDYTIEKGFRKGNYIIILCLNFVILHKFNIFKINL